MRWMLALLVAGCGGSSNDPDAGSPLDVDGQNGACTAFEGKQFRSVEQHECGLGPGGVIMCHWTIELEAIDPMRSRFMWHHSDVIENGAVRCTGRNVTTDGIGSVYTGMYDPGTRRLRWDAFDYALP